MIKTSTYKTPEQQRPYVKPSIAMTAIAIGALNGVEKAVTDKRSQKVLYPLDKRFFNFISKASLGKKITKFLTTTKDIAGDQIKFKHYKFSGRYSFNSSLMFKGAAVAAGLYMIPQLIKKTVDAIKNYRDR